MISEKIETIKQKLKEDFLLECKKENVEYIESQNDSIALMLDAFAYRILLQNISFIEAEKNLFLHTAKGKALDILAENLFATKRKKGTKPSVEIEFEKQGDSKETIRSGTVFRSKTGDESILLEEVVFEQSEKKKRGVLQLQRTIKESAVKTDIPSTNLSFLTSIKQLGNFANGGEKETDEELRKRCFLALQRLSTAGSEKSYEYHCLEADSRIDDVKVVSKIAGEVIVYYYSKKYDEAMRIAVSKRLADPRYTPTSIKIETKHVDIKEYAIKAKIFVEKEIDKNALKTNIETTAPILLKKEQRIGKSLSIFQIKNILAVSEKIKKVELEKPLEEEIEIEDHEILSLTQIELVMEDFT